MLQHLGTIPEALPLAELQDAERLQAALVLSSQGDYQEFQTLLNLAHTDWRDVLVSAELADDDWPKKSRRTRSHVIVSIAQLAACECDYARAIRSGSTRSAGQAVPAESTNQTGVSKLCARSVPTSAIHAGDRHSKISVDIDAGLGTWPSPDCHPSHSEGVISTG